MVSESKSRNGFCLFFKMVGRNIQSALYAFSNLSFLKIKTAAKNICPGVDITGKINKQGGGNKNVRVGIFPNK